MNRLRWRRWWFRVHQWLGVALALLVIPLSLSGAALVWHDGLDRLLHPARHATSGTALLGADAYVAAVRLAPGERIATLTFGHGPVQLAAAPAHDPRRTGPPTRRVAYLDPPTARVLDVASSMAGPVRFIHVLHGSLQVPVWGRTVVGWLGLAMLVSSLSGLWLWWPVTGRWTRGLRWRRRGDLNANLHHLAGFWIALPLFVVSLTGAWIAFPGAFGAMVGAPPRLPAPRARPAARTALSAQVAIARALRVTPGRVEVVTWPTERSPDWHVAIAGRTVAVADDGGVAVLARVPAGQGDVARLMRRLHSGEGMGPVWQALLFITGLLPALLAVTGLVMWWLGRRWRSS